MPLELVQPNEIIQEISDGFEKAWKDADEKTRDIGSFPPELGPLIKGLAKEFYIKGYRDGGISAVEKLQRLNNAVRTLNQMLT